MIPLQLPLYDIPGCRPVEVAGQCANHGCRHNWRTAVGREDKRNRKPLKRRDALPLGCSLVVAEQSALKGGMTLDEVGRFFGVTRERARQMEASALRKSRLDRIFRELRR